MFDGTFGGLDKHQLVALVSCLVAVERGNVSAALWGLLGVLCCGVCCALHAGLCFLLTAAPPAVSPAVPKLTKELPVLLAQCTAIVPPAGRREADQGAGGAAGPAAGGGAPRGRPVQRVQGRGGRRCGLFFADPLSERRKSSLAFQ